MKVLLKFFMHSIRTVIVLNVPGNYYPETDEIFFRIEFSLTDEYEKAESLLSNNTKVIDFDPYKKLKCNLKIGGENLCPY